MNVFNLSFPGTSEPKLKLGSRHTPQKIRWSNRARVVFPLDEGPEIPTIKACSGSGSSGEVILCVDGVYFEVESAEKVRLIIRRGCSDDIVILSLSLSYREARHQCQEEVYPWLVTGICSVTKVRIRLAL